MTMMAVTVQAVELLVALKDAQIVNLIGLLTDLNAVIQPGMSMVLTAPHLKALITGIVQAVTAQVIMVALTVEPMVVIVVLVM